MRFSIAILFLVFSCWSFAHEEQKPTQATLVTQQLKTLEHIYENGKDIYCYWDLKKEVGVNWEEIIEKARNQVLFDQLSNLEFYGLLEQTLAAVKDGHVNYYSPLGKYNIYYAPISFEEVEGHVVVSSINELLYTPRFRVGSIVTSINGVSIEEAIRIKEKSISASTPHALRTYAIRSLQDYSVYEGIPEESFRFSFKNSLSDSELETELSWEIYEYDRSQRKIKPLNEIIQSKILPGNIGYLRLKAMMSRSDSPSDFIDRVHKMLDNLSKTQALLIDVRGNGGGMGRVGDHIVSRLIDEDIPRAKISLRLSKQLGIERPDTLIQYESDWDKIGGFSDYKKLVIEPNKDKAKYDKPVFVLTDGYCFSACDTFVDSISSNKLGLILGSRTSGGTGTPLGFHLPFGHGSVRFSVLAGKSNAGHMIEGNGTMPDIPIIQTLENYKKGDSILREAHRTVYERVLTGPVPEIQFEKEQEEEFLPGKAIQQQMILDHEEFEY